MHAMIVDTGSMLFVMNKKHVDNLGINTFQGKANIDTSLGSQGTQQHVQWDKGELMLVIAPGTSNEMVLVDVTGISPTTAVNFDVLLSVDVLHAMAAGVMPATPQRTAALVYHPHCSQNDFVTKAYLPIRVFKPEQHPSDSRTAVDTSLEKSTWPGESMTLTR